MKRRSTASTERTAEISRIIAILHKWGVHTLGDLAALEPRSARRAARSDRRPTLGPGHGESTRLLRLVRPTEKFSRNKSNSSTKSKPPSRSFLSSAVFSSNSPSASAPFISSRSELTPPAHVLPTSRATSIVFRFPIRPTRSKFCSASSRAHLENFRAEHPIVAVALEVATGPAEPGNSFIFSRHRCAIRAGCTRPSPAHGIVRRGAGREAGAGRFASAGCFHRVEPFSWELPASPNELGADDRPGLAPAARGISDLRLEAAGGRPAGTLSRFG